MANEVFDDVAFFWVAMSVLLLVFIPWTLAKLFSFISKDRTKAEQIGCQCEICKVKQIKQAELELKMKGNPHFTFSNVLYAVILLLLLYMAVLLPDYQGQELQTFNPYEILNLEPGATDKEIKKAYRTESMLWHPDKNPNNPDAEQKFILISKAHQALTDDAQKENMDKYGNPDGPQGMSITIGLPSFLLKKENEITVLLFYLVLAIVLPAVGVLVWYVQNKKYHKSGVRNDTRMVFFQEVQDNMMPKQLIKVVSKAAEYMELMKTPLTPEESAAVELLTKEVKSTVSFSEKKLKKGYVDAPYVVLANTILHAYLLEIPIPPILEEISLTILKDVHMLMDALLGLALAKRNLKLITAVITLMQHMTQGLWVDMDPLCQLPPQFTSKCIKIANKKRLSFIDLVQLPQKKKEHLFPDLTEDDWAEIDMVATAVPMIETTHRVEVAGESGFFEGDKAKLTATLKRVDIRAILKEQALAADAAAAAVAEEESKVQQVKPIKPVVEETEEGKDVQEDDDEDKSGKSFDEMLDEMETVKKVTKKQDCSPLVHSAHFPLPKREQWYVLLLCTKMGDKRDKQLPPFPFLMGYAKTKSFAETETIDIDFPLFRSGMGHFEMHIFCDSYVGTRFVVPFKMQILKKSDNLVEQQDTKVKEKSGLGLDLDEDEETCQGEEEEEKEIDLGILESDWLNYLVLLFIFWLLYQWMHSMGTWQKYVDPIIHRFLIVTKPLQLKIYPVIKPVWDPLMATLAFVYNALGNMLHRDVEDLDL